VSVLDSERARGLLERAGLGGLQPRTLKAVMLLAGAACAVAVWRFWPAAPVPEIAFDAEAAEQSGSAAGSVETSAPAEADVVVHVAGAVVQPGVYSLAPGSRVVDAIAAAGGGLGNAALDALNLARILSDGEQVYVLTADQVASGAAVPSAGAGAAGGGSSAGGLVNLNTASAEELDALPGVGPSTAEKIVADREANGPFATPEDLMRVSGIGAAKYESLKDLVTCN
jgi:competence protein ComEA